MSAKSKDLAANIIGIMLMLLKEKYEDEEILEMLQKDKLVKVLEVLNP